MSRLILALGILVPGVVLYLTGMSRLSAERADLARQRARLDEFAHERASAREASTATAQTLTNRLLELEAVRQSMVLPAEFTTVPPPAADAAPTGEPWRSETPYVDLDKRYLKDLGFQALSGDHRLTDAAAALFGLSPVERAGVNEALREFRTRLEALQLEKAAPLPGLAERQTDDHHEVGFAVPSLKEESRVLREEALASIRSQVGEQRAGMLAGKITEALQFDTNPMDMENLVIVFSADRLPDGSINHRLTFTDPERPGNRYSLNVPFDLGSNQGATSDDGWMVAGVGFPLAPNSPMWGYRHLFGDQPLMTGR
ncbi:MAG: hypothetical protein IT580_07400 [Verrucomicrobiales bacterium]|nr:hypothetical protein [Verrucomicrobiales bacterium]